MARNAHPTCERIRAARTLRRMSQAALAEILGVTQSAVCRMEQSEFPPALDMIERVARALEVPPASLLPDGFVRGNASSAPSKPSNRSS